jgi:hypothetical protein
MISSIHVYSCTPSHHVLMRPRVRVALSSVLCPAVSVDGAKTAAVVLQDPKTGQTDLREASVEPPGGARAVANGNGAAAGAAKVPHRRSRAVVFDVVGLDVGAENPAFAVLAADDGEDDVSAEDMIMRVCGAPSSLSGCRHSQARLHARVTLSLRAWC